MKKAVINVASELVFKTDLCDGMGVGELPEDSVTWADGKAYKIGHPSTRILTFRSISS